jgi:hypothetical protein
MKFQWYHIIIAILIIGIAFKAGYFPGFMGSVLSTSDGMILYGEYTLSDYVPPTSGTTCPTGYTYNTVRAMCELTYPHLATFASSYGFTNYTAGAWTTISNQQTCVFQQKKDTSKYWTMEYFNCGASPGIGGGDPYVKLSSTADGSGHWGIATAVSNQGFKGKHFKTDLSVASPGRSYSDRASATLYVSDSKNLNVNTKIPTSTKTITIKDWSASGSSAFSFDGVLELKESVLDPNIYEVYLGGLKQMDINIASWNDMYIIMRVYATGDDQPRSVTLNGIKPRWTPLYSCQMEENDILGYEIFSGPQDISLYSTRYAVKKFCVKNLAVVYDQASGGSEPTAEIYDKMISGSTYTIPQGQLVGMFYIFHNDGSLSVTCPGEAYDVANNRCIVPGGLATICSAGTFDPSAGTCVVTPNTTISCPSGGYYDTAQNTCVYHPPIQYICAYGTYSAQSGKCEYIPPTQANCPTGTTWNLATGFCESFPASQIICDPFYAYDSNLNKCVRHVESQTYCIDGTYDSATQSCIKELPTQPVCSQGVLSEDLSKCVYEPETEGVCASGALYDATEKKCILTPDYDYLCANGELITKEDGTLACEIQLEGFHICPAGYEFDGTDCKDVSGTTCSLDAECTYTCPSGKTIGDCIDGKCSVNPTECQSKTSIFYSTIKLVPVWAWVVLVGLLIYFVWEKGPKSGFFKK